MNVSASTARVKAAFKFFQRNTRIACAESLDAALYLRSPCRRGLPVVWEEPKPPEEFLALRVIQVQHFFVEPFDGRRSHGSIITGVERKSAARHAGRLGPRPKEWTCDVLADALRTGD